MNRIIHYFGIIIFSSLYHQVMSTGKLEFFNHISNHPEQCVVAVIKSFDGRQYADQPGPCFLVCTHGMEHPFTVDSNFQSPNGPIYIFEHTQFNNDPNKARNICNNGKYHDLLERNQQKFSRHININPGDKDKEIHYGKPEFKSIGYEERKRRGEIIEIPIKKRKTRK